MTYFWIMFSKPKSIFLSTIILLDYFFFLFSSTKRVVIAICGVGRAGTIHLFNALHNHLIKVKYLVDLDVKKVMKMKKEYFLEEIIIVHADEFDKVLSIYAKNRNFSKVSSRVTRTIFSFYVNFEPVKQVLIVFLLLTLVIFLFEREMINPYQVNVTLI